MIYHKNTYKYLIRKYNENLVKNQIDFGKLINELNFSVETSYLSELPYPYYCQVKFPDVSDEWMPSHFSEDKVIELLDKEIDPKIIYNYSFFYIDQNIFSLLKNWFMTAVDVSMKTTTASILIQLEKTLKFLNENCLNNTSLNKYLDLWCSILTTIVETDNSYLINERRFGDYLNRNEYYSILALLSGNKK